MKLVWKALTITYHYGRGDLQVTQAQAAYREGSVMAVGPNLRHLSGNPVLQHTARELVWAEHPQCSLQI